MTEQEFLKLSPQEQEPYRAWYRHVSFITWLKNATPVQKNEWARLCKEKYSTFEEVMVDIQKGAYDWLLFDVVAVKAEDLIPK